MDNMISLKITQDENEAYISLPAETLDFSKTTAIQITDCVIFPLSTILLCSFGR